MAGEEVVVLEEKELAVGDWPALAQVTHHSVVYTYLTAVGCVGTSYTVRATPLKAVTALPQLTVKTADITGQLAAGVTLLHCMYMLLSDIIAVVVPVAGSMAVILALTS
jgi:hypothetical protein